jgi:hypothetical protein
VEGIPKETQNYQTKETLGQPRVEEAEMGNR